MGALMSFIVAVVVAAVVIVIVSKLGLGLSVGGFMLAAIAAVVIAVVGSLVLWLLGFLGLSSGGGFMGTLIYLVVAAVVLMLSDKFVPGMKVNGFMGGGCCRHRYRRGLLAALLASWHVRHRHLVPPLMAITLHNSMRGEAIEIVRTKKRSRTC